MSFKELFSLAYLCLLLSSIHAQKAEVSQSQCGITTSIQEASQNYDYPRKLSKYKSRVSEVTSKKLKNNAEQTIPCPNGITIIPIAFHLFHEPGAKIGEQHNYNLSKLNLTVDYLNMHFSGVNPRKEILGDEFAIVDAGNTCIQFTIGKINRIDTESCAYWKKNKTQYELHKCLPGGSGTGSENDPNDFLNIYVTELHGGLLGQASNIPGILGKCNADSDGVTISRNIIIPGLNNGSLYNKGGILAHEIGHWLGLTHVDGDIQGSGCEGDDGIDDTYPQEKKNTYICSEAIPHSCGTPDNVYNFMDYSMDCAKLMFTKQQSIIMNDILLHERKELSTSYDRMDKSIELYSLEPSKEFSTPIEWLKVECQGNINLLQYQQKWTLRLESNQSFSGSKNYYWERSVTSSIDGKPQILDSRYLSNHNVLSGISDLKFNSAIIYKLKEQTWSSHLKKYESTKTKGILLIKSETCPSPNNDKLENATELNQGTLCNEERYSLLNANSESDNILFKNVEKKKDVWFKMNISDKEKTLEIKVSRPNSIASSPMIEAYDNKMNPLKIIIIDYGSSTNYRIDKTVGISEIYLRAYDQKRPIADPFSICVVQNTKFNDECVDAYEVRVLKSCQWMGYSFEGSTPSAIENVKYNCGENYSFYDVWFETIVPKSGNFSIKCKNREGSKKNLLLEVYSGSCGNMKLIGCQMAYGISNIDAIAYLPFVGLNSGDKVFIRVGGKGYGAQGQFDLCVSQSFENICTITKIELLENFNCNNLDQTYSQELEVSYQSTGALNKLIVNGQYFTLIENPQKIILRNIPYNKPFSLKANLINLEDPSCWSHSGYSIEGIHTRNSPCETVSETDNICANAELIEVDAECNNTKYTLSQSTASKYHHENGCFEDQKDKWFEVIVPKNGDLSIELSSDSIADDFRFEVYQGVCEDMHFLICSAAIRDSSEALVLKELAPGTILYIRVADYYNRNNASFSLCIKEFTVAQSRTYATISNPVSDQVIGKRKNIASIHCFPNPTVDYTEIVLNDFEKGKHYNISLQDSKGHTILSSSQISPSFKMDLSTFTSGIYFLLIQDGHDRQIKRIVRS